MRFRFSGTLLRFVDYRKEIELDAPTLAAAIEELLGQYPDLRGLVLDSSGRLRSTHRLFLGGEMIKNQQLGLKLKKDDCIAVVTQIAGG
jgi:sulfur-carrier protein